MTLNLGVTAQLGGTSTFVFNSYNLAFFGGVGTALYDDGWSPAIAQYGSNMYLPQGLYEPVQEKIRFQIFASGNDAPAKIHRRLQILTFILDRAKQARKYNEINYPILFYTVSGANNTVPSASVSNTTMQSTLIYEAKLILPQNYMRTLHLKKALDVEVELLRDGLWFNTRSYQSFYVYSGIRNNSLLAKQAYTILSTSFINSNTTGLSDYANGLDVITGPFPSVNNNYYMPNGYIVSHNGIFTHGYCETTGSLFEVGTKDSSISDQSLVIGSTTYSFVRHNPVSSGWVTFMQNGRFQSSMELVTGDGSTYDPNYSEKFSHTHHIFGEFTTSGTVSFVVQPILQSYSGLDSAFYGQEIILSNVSFPEYVYLGVINTYSEDSPMVLNYRTRRISGSGTLQVKDFHVFSTDKISITKLNVNPTLSGVINPYTVPVKPSGWLALTHNYAGTIGAPQTGTSYPRSSAAINGPNVRFIAETIVPFESNVADTTDLGTFLNNNFAYAVNATGNYGMLLEPKSFFGANAYEVQDQSLAFSTALLWSQGSNRNSWRFMYPSGVFAPSVYMFLTPFTPTVARI